VLLSGVSWLVTTKARVPPLLTGLLFIGVYQVALTLVLARRFEADRVLEHFTSGFIEAGTRFAGADPAHSVPWAVIAALVLCLVLVVIASKFPRLLIGSGKAPLLPLVMISGAFYALSGTLTATTTATIDPHFMQGALFSVLTGVLAGGLPLHKSGAEDAALRSPDSGIAIGYTLLRAALGVMLSSAVVYMADFIFPVSGVTLLVQTLIVGGALVKGSHEVKQEIM
jgi:hypothetical protein